MQYQLRQGINTLRIELGHTAIEANGDFAFTDVGRFVNRFVQEEAKRFETGGVKELVWRQKIRKFESEE